MYTINILPSIQLGSQLNDSKSACMIITSQLAIIICGSYNVSRFEKTSLITSKCNKVFPILSYCSNNVIIQLRMKHSITNPEKLTDLEQHIQNRRYRSQYTQVYFMQIRPVFSGQPTYVIKHAYIVTLPLYARVHIATYIAIVCHNYI